VAEPFLAEIRMMSFNFPPKGWALANGQLLPINQNQALFSLLGTTYGGNGQTTFGLPNLQGRVPIHVGGGHTGGETGGEGAHTLVTAELPAHTHSVGASLISEATGGVTTPVGNFLGGVNNMYHVPPSSASMHSQTVANTGGGQSHSNMQPYLTVSFCIALQGIFPSRN
jgi:microcystin-dependent protein